MIRFARPLVLLAALGLAAPLAAQETGARGPAAADHSGHAAPDPTAAGGVEPMPAAAGPAASQAYMQAMADMDAAMSASPMTGRADTDFAAMMIPHHRSAIAMAEAYLASGDGDPVLTRMAEEIRASQAAEIATLEAWLAANPAP